MNHHSSSYFYVCSHFPCSTQWQVVGIKEFQVSLPNFSQMHVYTYTLPSAPCLEPLIVKLIILWEYLVCCKESAVSNLCPLRSNGL